MNSPRRALLALPLTLLLGCLPAPLGPCVDADLCGDSSTGPGTTEALLPTTSDGVHTVTGDAPDPDPGTTTPDDTGAETTSTTSEPAEPPLILDGVVIPDFIADNGVLNVSVTTQNAAGVHLLLDSGDLIELSPGQPDEFVGQIPAFTAQDNGKHTAVLTPWRDVLAGEPVPVDYVIALPPLGFEIGWDTDGIKGSVAAIAVLPDGRPVEFGTTDEQGQPRCYLRLRDREAAPLELVPLLPGAFCRAVDLKIDRSSGVLHLLLERESGNNIVWWAGEISAWGKGPKNIGVGPAGDTAFALATRPDVVAVCGSRAVATADKLDALAVLLRTNEAPETRVFDYQQPSNPKPHLFAETARDCTFAGDTLVLVGEANGKHDGANGKIRDRLTVIESDITTDDDPVWTVPGIEEGFQTRALALDLDLEGRYHLAGYACSDACDPVGELWTYAPGGKLLERSAIGPLGSPLFGPHDIAWSPAGYAVVALGELQDQSFVFKVQAFEPGEPLPLWTFLPSKKQGLQLALALAIGPFGEVYAGGIGNQDHPAFARIGS